MEAKAIPEVVLNSGHKMPILGFGTGTVPLPPSHELIPAFIEAIQTGYRHFDTAAYYGSEESLGQAIAQALDQGLIKTRSEIFVTTKLWCTDAHPGLVLPALKSSLQRLGLEYVDLYLIHFPVRLRQGVKGTKYGKEDILQLDMKGTWEDMEQCSKLGLAKSIGLSNFGVKKLSQILQNAIIPPALVQVEMNAAWKQENLRNFCKDKGIHVSAWSPLGANGAVWGSLAVMDSPILKDIALTKGKSVAQVALRWIIQQGATPIVKSFNSKRMKENLNIFCWELSQADMEKAKQIPQHRGFTGELTEEQGERKSMAGKKIPDVLLNSGQKMPVIGMGTSVENRPSNETLASIYVDAIGVGYRHFDTASVYGTEEAVGLAVAKAIDKGLLKSRDEVFITSKPWNNDAHRDLIVPALKTTLKKLGMEYVDLYLIHWPVRLRHDLENPTVFSKEDLLPFDIEGTWKGMEECYKLGLAKSIGICNYGTKKLTKLLEIATIPPAVNQVEMNPSWQQGKLREFCKQKGIHVSAWSALGAYKIFWGSGAVMENPILKDIATAKGKTIAQVALRWVYQQGSSAMAKSTNNERMKQNLDIFDFELSEEDLERISQVPQRRQYTGDMWLSENGSCKTLEELWDDDVYNNMWSNNIQHRSNTRAKMETKKIPEVRLNSGQKMPVIGLGTAAIPLPAPEVLTSIIIDAFEVGYRHFDTASLYGSEEPLGKAVAKALELGLIKSRDEVFITSKLWTADAHPDLVVPALKTSLQKLGLEYVDLYLVHWPVRLKPEARGHHSILKENVIPYFDMQGTWEAMEECCRLGLAKSIGVSNFGIKKITQLLENATIPPAVNQVEMNLSWQQGKLREFCKQKGIHVSAWSPLGAYNCSWGSNAVMESQILKEIASAKQKSIAQIALRWIYEQGAIAIVKSFNKERMKENFDIFGWELSQEESQKFSQIPQRRMYLGIDFVTENGPYKTLEELWDGDP
ncbi:hypothetical protein CR513_15337, partial [Mucuna pruriens]